MASKNAQRGILIFLALLHIALGAFFLLDRSSGTDAARRGFPLDDAWIHMVYARSIAEYGAPYYNDGQLETGFSSPLWMLLLALLHFVHKIAPTLDPVLLVKWLGVACGFFASWGVFVLAQRIGVGILGATLAALLNALAPPLVFAQVSGMEVSLAAALVLAGLISWHDQKYGKTGWILAAAYWTRPELALLFVFTLALSLLSWKGYLWKERRKDLLRLVGPFLFAAGLWAGYCYATTGSPLPNTATAKFQFQGIERWGNFFAEALWPMPANFFFSGTILFVLGEIAWLRQASATRIATLIFPWLFFFAIALTRRQPHGIDLFFYHLRYGLPALPLLFIAVGAGFHWLWNGTQESGSKRYAMRGIAIALAALASIEHPFALQARASMYSRNCKNTEELQANIGRWLAQNTPQDAVIVSHDAGATRYFSGSRRLIDTQGLNDHALAQDAQTRDRLTFDTQALVTWMQKQGAEYLVLVPTFFPRLVEDSAFAENFEPVFLAESIPYTLGGLRHTKMGVWKRREK